MPPKKVKMINVGKWSGSRIRNPFIVMAGPHDMDNNEEGDHDQSPEHGAGSDLEPDTPETLGFDPEEEPYNCMPPANPPVQGNPLQGGGVNEDDPEWEVEDVRSEGGTPIAPDEWRHPYWIEGRDIMERDTWIHPDWARQRESWVYCEDCCWFWWDKEHPYAQERLLENKVLPNIGPCKACITCGGIQRGKSKVYVAGNDPERQCWVVYMGSSIQCMRHR